MRKTVWNTFSTELHSRIKLKADILLKSEKLPWTNSQKTKNATRNPRLTELSLEPEKAAFVIHVIVIKGLLKPRHPTRGETIISDDFAAKYFITNLPVDQLAGVYRSRVKVGSIILDDWWLNEAILLTWLEHEAGTL